MKRIILLIALLSGLNIFSALPSIAEGPEYGHDHDGKGMGRFLKELDLNEEQRNHIKALRPEREKLHDLRDKVRSQRRELREMFSDDSASRDEVLGKVKELNSNMAELNIGRAQHLLSMREILTKDQRAKAREIFEQRRKERFGEGHDKDDDDDRPFMHRFRDGPSGK